MPAWQEKRVQRTRMFVSLYGEFLLSFLAGSLQEDYPQFSREQYPYLDRCEHIFSE
jgi:hypothetical protein